MASKHAREGTAWEEFFGKCLAEHTDYFDEFPKAFEEQQARMPLSGSPVFEALIKHGQGMFWVRDRLLIYFEILFQKRVFSDVDVLESLIVMFKNTMAELDYYGPIKTGSAAGQWRQSVEAAVLRKLAYYMAFRRDEIVKSGHSTADYYIFPPLCSFVSKFVTMVENTGPLVGPVLDIGLNLGQYVGAYINDLAKVGILTSDNGGPPQVFRNSFGRWLPPFINLISSANSELGQTLMLLQKQSGLQDDPATAMISNDTTNAVDLDALTYQENVLDTPSLITRSALYIYLNAMLTGRPLYNDSALYTFISARYNNDIPNLVTELITAAFDVLANSINRTESNASIMMYRSFLTNKLPLLLEPYSTLIFLPLTIEVCITEALNRMDPSTDPYSAQGYDMLSNSGMLHEARVEFLFACALHNLIAEQSIESILGDVPMQSLPKGGKYVKTDLVAQCNAIPGRFDELAGELENMEGNAGEVVGALIEIIQSLCSAKDSITLKNICNTLSKRPQTLEIILIFTQPSAILQPLCELLDHWQHHDDQGEHHPVYDEFSSIFLLILVFRQHFNLQESDFGITYPDSFVLTYIRTGAEARDPSDLNDQEALRLGAWIKGLYETEGIDDEVMSKCSPKNFHLLVATLFDQSLTACEAGILGLDTLKGGFEYLVQPFLLPSLVTGLGHFATVLWKTHSPAPTLDIQLPVLQTLVKPSLSGEAAILHDAVLSIVAKPLEHALAHVQCLHPRRADIDPLLKTLQSRAQPQRSDLATASEIESWCSTSGGSLLGALHHSFRALVQWSTSGASNTPPPSYTHRQLVTTVLMLGAKRVFDALLDDILKEATKGTGDTALDVVTAFICAPVADNGKGRLSLRNVLLAAFNDSYKLSKKDPARAEMTVRLYRRVESQMVRLGSQDLNDVAAAEEDILMGMDETVDGGGTAIDAELDMQMAEVVGNGDDLFEGL